MRLGRKLVPAPDYTCHTSPCTFLLIPNMRSASSIIVLQSSSQTRLATGHVCLHASGPRVFAPSRVVYGAQPRGEFKVWPNCATGWEAAKKLCHFTNFLHRCPNTSQRRAALQRHQRARCRS